MARAAELRWVVIVGIVACAGEPPPPPVPSLTTAKPEASPVVELRFRQVIAGLVPYPNRRVTWTLRFSPTSTTLERIESTAHSGRIDEDFGKTSFTETKRLTYYGKPVSPPRDHLRLRLDAQVDADAGSVTHFDFLCERSTIRALPPNAWLVPARGSDEPGGVGARWMGSPVPTSVLRCADVMVKLGLYSSAFEERRGDGADTLEFGELPGVEWVFEHSDEVAQQGAYRLLPHE